MRNLKRALSLALASVMLLGMMVVGTSAASYPDVDENDNIEAIEVLNAVKVMIGDRGNFKPDDPVNRHEMAVIMAKLVLGNETADNYVGTHPFTDVAPWADKYVAACYENGIAAGTSRTTFGGDQPLTAVQAAAFMLRALGYKDLSKDASDWSVPVTAMANQIRLFSGVASNPKEELNRNQVAQLALNTLKSPMVDLKDNTLNISGGTGDGAFVITGGSRDYVVRSSSERYAQAINNTEAYGNSASGVSGYTVELGEHLFNGDLRLYDNRADDFGRPAIEWRYKSESIGTYTKEADLTYTKNVKVGTIYKDLSLNRSIDAGRVTVFVDGKQITTAGGNDLRNEIKSGDDTNGYGANGVLTQVWFDDKTNTDPSDDEIIISEVHTYVANVNAVNKASGSTERSITLDAKTRPGTLNTKFETESFEAKDLVTYTAAYNGSRYDIVTVAPLSQSASGVLTQWVGTTVVDSNKGQADSNFTVDSTKYEYSKNYYTVKDDGTPAALWNDFTVNKSSVNVYLDKYGYAIYIEGVEGSKDWAAVIGVGQTNPYGSQTQGVTLLLTDGTQKTVTAKMASGYSWSDLTGVTTNPSWDSDNLVNEGSADLVSYIDDDGTYELTILGTTGVYSTTYAGVYSANNPKVDFKNGRSTLTLTTDGTPANTTTLFTTSNTIFLVCTDNGSDKSYNAYVGYDNMPSIDSTIGVRGIAYRQNNAYTNQVDIVYIDAANLAGTSVNTFFVKEKNHKIETTSDLGSIYRVNAIVNGEKQELMIRSTIAAVDNNATEYGLFAIDNVITNSKGVITGFKDVTDRTTFDLNTGAVGHTTTADRGTVEANGTVVGFGKNGAINANPEYAAYDAASKVYYVDKDFKDINEIGVTGVSDDSNDYVWAARDNTVPASWKKLKDMIIVEVPDSTGVDSYTVSVSGSVANMSYTVTDGTTTVANSSLSVTSGANVTVTFTANTGYVFTENGSTTLVRTLSGVVSDQTVAAPAVQRGVQEITLKFELDENITQVTIDGKNYGNNAFMTGDKGTVLNATVTKKTGATGDVVVMFVPDARPHDGKVIEVDSSTYYVNLTENGTLRVTLSKSRIAYEQAKTRIESRVFDLYYLWASSDTYTKFQYFDNNAFRTEGNSWSVPVDADSWSLYGFGPAGNDGSIKKALTDMIISVTAQENCSLNPAAGTWQNELNGYACVVDNNGWSNDVSKKDPDGGAITVRQYTREVTVYETTTGGTADTSRALGTIKVTYTLNPTQGTWSTDKFTEAN